DLTDMNSSIQAAHDQRVDPPAHRRQLVGPVLMITAAESGARSGDHTQLSPTTQQTYRRDIEKYILSRFASYRIGRLPPGEIENWLMDEVDAGLLPEVEEEPARPPRPEEVAIRTVMLKLEALGSRLPYPHQSLVRGAQDLRELRPRSGRSPWRAFYRRVDTEEFLVGSVGP
ncbi:MAG TPA: hypothetical protein VIJ34_06170, partial [Acidimicrobiales bacterium]